MTRKKTATGRAPPIYGLFSYSHAYVPDSFHDVNSPASCGALLRYLESDPLNDGPIVSYIRLLHIILAVGQANREFSYKYNYRRKIWGTSPYRESDIEALFPSLERIGRKHWPDR